MNKLFLVISAFAAGAVLAAWLVLPSAANQAGNVIAMSWGDGKYGKAFYGAQVYTDAFNPPFTVRARVRIGPGNPMYHDCGVLGTAASFEDVVRKWGTIEWAPDGLRIGDFFLPRARMEAHR